MWNRTTKTDKGSRGQVLPMAALMMVVLVAFTGLAIDTGRLFIAKAELVRAVDAAALAGTLELPNLSNAQAKALTYMYANEPTAHATAVCSATERQVQVTGTKTVNVIFMRIFGISSVDISAGATAGYGVLAVDTVLVMDDTGTMSGNPITQSKTAAKGFVDVLLSGSVGAQATKVGFTPFRGCYNPTANINPLSESDPKRGCVKLTDAISLSTNKTAINASIDLLQAPGGFPGTNLCLGLANGWKILSGAGTQANDRKVLVILTDGDNSYTDYSQGDKAAPNSVPTANRHLANPAPNTYPASITNTNATPVPVSYPLDICWPGATTQDSTDHGNDYDNRVNQLDLHTRQQAENLKAQGVEIFVVGFGNTSTDNGTKCIPGTVGTGSSRQNHENYDRNLAKCIASSQTNTNDHFYEAAAASQLPDIFAKIARLVGFRLIK